MLPDRRESRIDDRSVCPGKRTKRAASERNAGPWRNWFEECRCIIGEKPPEVERSTCIVTDQLSLSPSLWNNSRPGITALRLINVVRKQGGTKRMTDTPGLSFSLKEKYRNRVIVWKKFYNLPTISRRKRRRRWSTRLQSFSRRQWEDVRCLLTRITERQQTNEGGEGVKMRVEFGVTRRRRERVARSLMEEKQKGPEGKQTAERRVGEQAIEALARHPFFSSPPRAVTKSDFFFRHAPSTMTKRRLASNWPGAWYSKHNRRDNIDPLNGLEKNSFRRGLGRRV